jgi:DNA/RNA-binding protein KIN17
MVYQEYISDRNHLHMNATRWNSLSEFAHYLGREGICEVDETEKGVFIKWIDKRPETLARQEAVQKKEKMEKTEEEREARLLAEQIEKAKSQAQTQSTTSEEKVIVQESVTFIIRLCNLITIFCL